MRKSEKVGIPPLSHPVWGGLLLTGLGCWIYGPTLTQPFVQDDWRLIHFFVFAESPWSVIREFITGKSFFYRPLPMLYHYAVYLVAGPNPVVVHALLIVWNIATACVILRTARVFGSSKGAALLIGACWLGSVYLLQDTTLWMVGVNEPACLLFCLMSLNAWWTGKSLAGGGWMALALLTKESAIYIPVTIGLYAGWMFLLEKEYSRARLFEWLRSLRPLIVVGALYTLLQLLRGLNIPTEDHPYAVALEPTGQSAAWGAYLAWLLHTFLPGMSTHPDLQNALTHHFKSSPFLIWIPVYLATLGLLLGCRRMDLHAAKDREAPIPRHPRQFLVFWTMASLIPFVIIPFHPYRYYLIHLLVPLFLLAESLCRLPAHRPTVRRVLWGCVSLYACILIVGNTVRFHAQYHAGTESLPIRGVNRLIHKGTESRIITRDLPVLVPEPSRDHPLIFLNTNLAAVHLFHGPEVIYGIRGLRVWTEKEIRKEDDEWIATWGEREFHFPEDGVSFYVIENGQVNPVPPPEGL